MITMKEGVYQMKEYRKKTVVIGVAILLTIAVVIIMFALGKGETHKGKHQGENRPLEIQRDENLNVIEDSDFGEHDVQGGTQGEHNPNNNTVLDNQKTGNEESSNKGENAEDNLDKEDTPHKELPKEDDQTDDGWTKFY